MKNGHSETGTQRWRCNKCDCFKRLDAVIVIRAPLLVRLWRAKKRDHLSLAQLLRRFAAQKSSFSQYFRKNADIRVIVLDNFGSGIKSGVEGIERTLTRECLF